MSSSTKNDARVTARIPQQIKETLEQAAILSGATLNQFIVGAALKEAQQILEADRAIALSQKDAEKVFSLLENPPTPNEKLKAAAAKHRAFFHETH
ncbi:protein of unknown function DUF1778 (plasmid) [Stanieria cyanosphaera PCC 7437]|uniref:DUF1778 domain-containing protein n=1 Tax=Stanieria cyanosphaera (strain ATCC 29371 / PCC 7437) TaxID=111780 RepID=K9Y198_STAC7|nr:DUF1778 domain-containing protein [Stanieria cyanosphaera]AFZ38171.1 protein of unknown function DUF1778 [Stanieria cyanosphaera PCC 7437]